MGVWGVFFVSGALSSWQASLAPPRQLVFWLDGGSVMSNGSSPSLFLSSPADARAARGAKACDSAKLTVRGSNVHAHAARRQHKFSRWEGGRAGIADVRGLAATFKHRPAMVRELCRQIHHGRAARSCKFTLPQDTPPCHNSGVEEMHRQYKRESELAASMGLLQYMQMLN